MHAGAGSLTTYNYCHWSHHCPTYCLAGLGMPAWLMADALLAIGTCCRLSYIGRKSMPT